MEGVLLQPANKINKFLSLGETLVEAISEMYEMWSSMKIPPVVFFLTSDTSNERTFRMTKKIFHKIVTPHNNLNVVSN